MPVVNCPIAECSYETPDHDAVIVAALITAHATTHTAAPASRDTVAARVEKVKRPVITSAGTSEDWTYFLSRWKDYVTATKVTGGDKIIQLLECCDDELRKDLTRSSVARLTENTEEEVLKAIKLLAVREESVMVARVALNNMQQDRDEPVRSFSARLRGQANICKYILNCPACDVEVNYTEPILRDALSRGIIDPDIQLDLLGNTNQDMSLDEVLHFVEAKESGKRSASRLLDSHGAAAVGSTYQKNKRAIDTTNSHNKTKLCSYCGKSGHGDRSASEVRSNACPAYGHKCKHCKRQHHFDDMCKSRSSNRNRKHIDECEGAIFDALCTVSNALPIQEKVISQNTLENQRNDAIQLDHHIHNQLSNTWKRKPSKPQPYLNITVTIVGEDYDHFGFKFVDRPGLTSATVLAMADTGCQSCLIGMKCVQNTGLKKEDLIPVTMKMHAANNKEIGIIGAVILRISGKGKLGKTVETRQMTYVTDNSDKFFLSKQACIDLGMITEHFPTIGETTSNHEVGDTANSRDQKAECGCLKRTLPPPLPTTLPFPATEENHEKLQQYLLDYYASSTFNVCEHQPLPSMTGPPMRLMIDSNAKPVAYHTPIPVPIHWQNEVKAGLDRDVQLGVIEPVPINDPVTWCHRMVICAKKDGQPRRTVDLQTLNMYATRDTHHTPSPFHQARSIPAGTKKTVSDAWNGYHSVPLCEEDRAKTTFITPWGRYRYCTAPQGYCAAGDGYSSRFDAIVSDVPNKVKVVDDTCLWKSNLEESFFQACEWLNICGANGMIQNPSKFKFGADTVEFAGFEVTANSVRPCKRYLQAIADFPAPKNITDVRSWFGLINQVSYAFSMTTRMFPFRELLKPKTPFYWDVLLNKLFEESKLNIISEIEDGVQIFDKSKPTCLATDWSKVGLGFWLFQKHCSCPGVTPFCCNSGWKIVLVGSRFTHPAESRYAPIEGEALTVAEALDKTRHFVLGCHNLIIAVDHKPLLKVFGDRALEDIPNTRLRNLKEKTLRYRFTMHHIPGKKHLAPDSLSRYPSGDTNPELLYLPDDVSTIQNDGRNDSIKHFLPELSICAIGKNLFSGIRCRDESAAEFEEGIKIAAISTLNSLQSVTWDAVRAATYSDENMRKLVDTIESGMPEKRHELPTPIQEYHQFRDSLSTVDGVAIYNDRIIIPPSLRQDVLTSLHAAHQGVTSMTLRAESSIFWPGITPAITELRSNCNHCNRMAPSQPSAPPTPPVSPDYPFQAVCSDFFHHQGHFYTVIVDRYSNWPIVERAQGGADGLINSLRRNFVTFGIPDELSSDGGPEFIATATRVSFKRWGVYHRVSSVSFPHSNCRAEIGVKTVKRMITNNTGSNGELDTEEFQRAMLQYRNTPDQGTKLSPAMCLFGRPIKDFIPILPGRYKPHATWRETLKSREEALRNRHMKSCERLSEHTQVLRPLVCGDHVRIQNQTGPHPTKWDKTGVVIEVRQFDQYVVRVDGSGRVTLRNRKFLRKYEPVIPKKTRRSVDNDIYKMIRPYPSVRQDNSAPTPITQEPETTLTTALPSADVIPLVPVAPVTPIPPTTVHQPACEPPVSENNGDRPVQQSPPLRRSTRVKTLPTRYERFNMTK